MPMDALRSAAEFWQDEGALLALLQPSEPNVRAGSGTAADQKQSIKSRSKNGCLMCRRRKVRSSTSIQLLVQNVDFDV